MRSVKFSKIYFREDRIIELLAIDFFREKKEIREFNGFCIATKLPYFSIFFSPPKSSLQGDKTAA